jgi:hypothetical protein
VLVVALVETKATTQTIATASKILGRLGITMVAWSFGVRRAA